MDTTVLSDLLTKHLYDEFLRKGNRTPYAWRARITGKPADGVEREETRGNSCWLYAHCLRIRGFGALTVIIAPVLTRGVGPARGFACAGKTRRVAAVWSQTETKRRRFGSGLKREIIGGPGLDGIETGLKPSKHSRTGLKPNSSRTETSGRSVFQQ